MSVAVSENALVLGVLVKLELNLTGLEFNLI